MDNNKDIQIIEAYLNNQLDEADKRAFEQRLEQSEELSAEFERHQMTHKALDFLVAKNLKAQLESLEAADSAETEQAEARVIPMKSRGRRLLMLRTAAAALVIIALGLFYLYFPLNQPTGLELASANYEMPDYNSRSSAETGLQNVLDNGLAALENKDYTQAINLLGSVQPDDGLYVQAQYFKGHAHFLDQQYAAAEQAFETVSQSNDLRYIAEAEWYGLLSCLAQNKACTEKVNTLLNNTEHPYYQKVKSFK